MRSAGDRALPTRNALLAEGAKSSESHAAACSSIDMLAVSYAAADRRADALATAREALAVARAEKRSDLTRALEDQVHSYENQAAAPRP